MPRMPPSDATRSSQDLDASGSMWGREGVSGLTRLRRYLVNVCLLYTVLTVLSSTIALSRGEETDTHAHLLMRLALVLLGLGAFELIAWARQRFPAAPLALLGLGVTLVLIAAVVASVWISGLAGVDLHPNAYRDAVLNVGVVGVVLVGLAGMLDLRRRRRRRRR